MSTLSLPIKRTLSLRTVRQLLWLLFLPAVLHAQEEKSAKRGFLSPDKQWECRVIDESVVLLKTGSDAPVLNLNEEIGSLAVESSTLVWAPDSRRFAFNSRGGGKSYVCELYELAGTTWKKLPDLFDNAKPVHEMIDRALRKQLKKLGAKKDANLNMVMSKWRVRRWLDNDTFEAYAGEGRRVMVHEKDEDWEYLGSAVLFRGKCDNRGGWKVTSSRELSDAEAGKINEEDD
jgi:hypothetical protein